MREMTRSLFRPILIMATLVACAGVRSGHASEQHHPPVTATLVIPSGPWEGPVTAVIHFAIGPQWHLYWSNPGDAGLPPTVQWRMPAGFQASPLRFPTPTKIASDGLLAYGYFNELILVSTITPPPGYRPDIRDSISADVEWLVCKESCLPGSAILSLPCAGRSPDDGEAPGLLKRFAQIAPVPMPPVEHATLVAHATRAGATVDLRFDALMQVDDFYPDLFENAVVDHESIRVESGTVSLRVLPSGPLAAIERMRGILRAGERSFSIDIPVHYQARSTRDSLNINRR